MLMKKQSQCITLLLIDKQRGYYNDISELYQCCVTTSFLNIYIRRMKLKYLILQPVHIQKYIE